MKLWGHQIEAITRAKACRDFGFFMEPGCGKTRTTIEMLRHHYNTNKRIMRTLVFAPPVVVPQWKEEFKTYSQIPQDQVHLLMGPGKKRAERVKELGQAGGILVTNYEALLMKDLFPLLVGWEPEILICDESQKLKNHQAKRTKAIIRLADLARHNYLLSGTPVLNTQLDLFSQFRVLDRGETFGRNYYAYRLTYFWDKNAGMPKQNYFPNWVPKPNATDDLKEKIQSKTIMVRKKDCLDLPPLIRQKIEVELGPQQQKVYDQMKKDFVAYINDEACVAHLAITKALRLTQIVSGFVRTDKEKEISFDKNPRLKALDDLIQTHVDAHKLIVWAVYKQNYKDIEWLCKKLSVEYATLTGETKDRQEEIDRFREQEKCRVLIANPGAGGVGINLVESDLSIYYSRTFSLEHDIQSEARNYRGGSERHAKITRIDLVAPRTIDEVILEALQKKQDLANDIMSIKNLASQI